MKRRLLILSALAVCLSVSAAAQTVDEIIAKNVAARGGLEKIKAVKSVRATGRMEVGPGMEAPVTLIMKRPNKMRVEFTVQGMTGSQNYDGKSGWQVMPFTGNKDPEPMSADDLKQSEEQADIDGPLVDYKAKGHQVELAGKEKVEGADTYKLKITMKNGDVRYEYIDADSFLTVKTEEKRVVRGTESEFEESVGDYKPVEGLMFPFAFEQGAKGSPQKQKLTVEKIELNVPVDDSLFVMPAPKPAESKPSDAKPAEKPPVR